MASRSATGSCNRSPSLLREQFGERVHCAAQRRRIRDRPMRRRADIDRHELLVEKMLRSVSRPFLFDERIIQGGAFAGIAARRPRRRAFPICLRRADIAMDRAAQWPTVAPGVVRRRHGARADRPKRDRAGHPLRPRPSSIRAVLRAAGRSEDRRDHRLRGAGAVDPPAVGDRRPRRVHSRRRGSRLDRPP